jgi:2-oxoacid dehydrogenases acyltransferase (catalytic domain)
MSPKSRRLPLSLPRRYMCDLLYFAQKVPAARVKRRMQLGPVVAVRQAAAPRPAWCVIFTKALAFVAAARPELRRAYLGFPWPHLYEHPHTVVAMAIERQYENEDAVFHGFFRSPEERGLQELDGLLRRYQEVPLAQMDRFRRVLQISRLPRPLRRLLLWMGLNVSGRWRARNAGTCGLSTVAGLGAAIPHLLSPLTATLNYGVIGPDGAVDVYLTFDHRVLDGATAARCLEDMERALNGELLTELRYFQALDAA